MPHTFIQPEGWVPPRGYSNGVVASGKTLFTGGVVGSLLFPKREPAAVATRSIETKDAA